MNATEFKVGDVWQLLAENHYALPAGSTFTVLAVDADGDAVYNDEGEIVASDRIDRDEVVLVSRVSE